MTFSFHGGIFAVGVIVIVEFASGLLAVTGPRALRPLEINRNKQTNTFRERGSPEEGYRKGKGKTQPMPGSLVYSWGPASSPLDLTPGPLLCHRAHLLHYSESKTIISVVA